MFFKKNERKYEIIKYKLSKKFFLFYYCAILSLKRVYYVINNNLMQEYDIGTINVAFPYANNYINVNS